MEKIEYDLPEPELVITFDPPLQLNNMGCESITLREPTAAQVRQAEGHLRSGVNPEAIRKYQIALVTSVSGMTQQVVDKMPVSKLTEAFEYLQGFINPPRATGGS